MCLFSIKVRNGATESSYPNHSTRSGKSCRSGYVVRADHDRSLTRASKRSPAVCSFWGETPGARSYPPSSHYWDGSEFERAPGVSPPKEQTAEIGRAHL